MNSTQQVFKLEKPIWDSNLPDKVLDLFTDLVDGAYNFNPYEYEEEHLFVAACGEYHEKVTRHATEHPVLAKAVSRDLLHRSLLATVVEKQSHECVHQTIKFLIERNPSALLWKRADMEEL